MKKCKIIHINDGNEVELQNGNRLFIEELPRTAEVIEKYLAEGYEVKHIIPDYTPSMQEEGEFTFFKTGIVVYLEKEE